jgi:hypothetical protein
VVVGQILDQDRLAVGPAQRDPPVRVLVRGPRLILRTPFADRIRQRNPDQLGRRMRDVLMQGLHDPLDVTVGVAQQMTLAQRRQPGVTVGLVDSKLLRDRRRKLTMRRARRTRVRLGWW